jgi:predicted RNA-binding Zn-ribbon protein involved in translation (DUF1610 family)
MSIKLGRMLMPHEEVDHIDGDKTNDALENLEVVSREENLRRQKLNYKKQMYEHICPECGKRFLRDKQRSYQHTKFGKQIRCSRSCVALYLSKKFSHK